MAKVYEKVTITDVTNAQRKVAAKAMHKAHVKAYDLVGDQLQFASTPYLIIGSFSVGIDAALTLKEPVQRIYKSSGFANLRKDDYLKDKIESLDIALSKLTKKELEPLTYAEKYYELVASYCTKNGKKPLQVLTSKPIHTQLRGNSYGSLDLFMASQEKSLSKIEL